jgi:hypothetical protein
MTIFCVNIIFRWKVCSESQNQCSVYLVYIYIMVGKGINDWWVRAWINHYLTNTGNWCLKYHLSSVDILFHYNSNMFSQHFCLFTSYIVLHISGYIFECKYSMKYKYQKSLSLGELLSIYLFCIIGSLCSHWNHWLSSESDDLFILYISLYDIIHNIYNTCNHYLIFIARDSVGLICEQYIVIIVV